MSSERRGTVNRNPLRSTGIDLSFGDIVETFTTSRTLRAVALEVREWRRVRHTYSSINIECNRDERSKNGWAAEGDAE